MAIFGYHDIDPLFDSLSEDSQTTVLSFAHGQAASFVSALWTTAKGAVQEGSKNHTPIPYDQEKVSEEDFNYLLSEAHPTILKAMFVMGFTQGFCLRHRLQVLDTELYSRIPVESLDSLVDTEERENPEESEEDESQEEVASEDRGSEDVGTSTGSE